MSAADPRDDPVTMVLSTGRAGEVVEVFLEDAASRTVTVVDGVVESSEDEHQLGAGIRIFRDARVGFGYTSDLTANGLRRAVETARAFAAVTRQDEANRPPASGSTRVLFVDEAPATPTPFAARLDLARQVEAAARRAAPSIKIRAAVAVEASGRVRIVHSAGLSCAWNWSRAWASIEVVAERGRDRQTGYETGWAPTLAGIDADRIGAEAAAQALRKFGATRPPTARQTIVLDPRVTAGLFETLAGALSGKAVARERSLFAGRLGSEVAASALTLVDDGAEVGGFNTAPYDGEGVPSTRAELIRGGVLTGYLHDTYTAARLGFASAGHAVREDHCSLPGVGTRNLHLAPTGPGRRAVLEAAGSGIYVDEVMGLHTVDPVSGDFSLGAVGRRLAGGEPGAALEGFAIAGNILGLLRSIEAVADDLRFFAGATGGSTVLLRDVLVSGA